MLQVHDDGRGFDTSDADTLGVGYGLRSMRERAERLGGELKVWSLRGVGTEVEVRIP
jgi:signal transduction histidine kinase